MFARRVSMNLKPNSVPELTQKLETQIIPLLRKQTRFLDEIWFVGQGETKAFGISLWDKKENAERITAERIPK